MKFFAAMTVLCSTSNMRNPLLHRSSYSYCVSQFMYLSDTCVSLLPRPLLVNIELEIRFRLCLEWVCPFLLTITQQPYLLCLVISCYYCQLFFSLSRHLFVYARQDKRDRYLLHAMINDSYYDF